jgi:GT2 family glycosyltransferase
VDVSVIISTRNNAGRLERTLQGLAGSHLRPGVQWEIVLVDNGSSDRTGGVIATWAGRLPIRAIQEPIQGLSRARNAGIHAAQGRLLVFTDDDTCVSPGWLMAYRDAYETLGEDHYFGGPIESEFEGPAPDPEFLPYAPASVKGLNWGPQARPLGPEEYFIGPNWACSAARVREAGCFDPRMGLGATGGPLGGEENDLMRRLEESGVHGWYLPAASLRHWVPAAKAGAAHIRARWEEYAAVVAWTAPASPPGLRVFGLPWRLPVHQAVMTARWLLACLGFGDPVRARMDLHWYAGITRGYRLPPR